MGSIEILLRNSSNSYPSISKRHLRVLLAHLMKQPMEFLLAHPETLVPSDVAQQFLRQVEKLAQGMPLSRLLGKREFWGMDFELSPETLDPRPDSETLIEAVLKNRPDRRPPLNILDLGTGTGCLIVSLLKEYPNAQGLAVDQSLGALEMAKKNAEANGVSKRLKFHHSDWFKGVQGTFDIIISNPPYITNKDYETLDQTVQNYDPIKALVAGEEGLDCYKTIIPAAPMFLKKRGLLVLEIGYGECDSVQGLMKQSGFHNIQVYKDLGGIERCLLGRK
ncbi:MAG: peptide chain release factor N(5)-glutamine methyltransferase [Alphaproteobacteria bacterium]